MCVGSIVVFISFEKNESWKEKIHMASDNFYDSVFRSALHRMDSCHDILLTQLDS